MFRRQRRLPHEAVVANLRIRRRFWQGEPGPLCVRPADWTAVSDLGTVA
jgi:hypothetical protein